LVLNYEPLFGIIEKLYNFIIVIVNFLQFCGFLNLRRMFMGSDKFSIYFPKICVWQTIISKHSVILKNERLNCVKKNLLLMNMYISNKNLCYMRFNVGLFFSFGSWILLVRRIVLSVTNNVFIFTYTSCRIILYTRVCCVLCTYKLFKEGTRIFDFFIFNIINKIYTPQWFWCCSSWIDNV